MSKIFELTPSMYDRAKSFYGKARVEMTDDGIYRLFSYNTEVAQFENKGDAPIFTRLWPGWSLTTQRHVNAFFDLLGFYELDYKGKANWDMFPVGQPVIL